MPERGWLQYPEMQKHEEACRLHQSGTAQEQYVYPAALPLHGTPPQFAFAIQDTSRSVLFIGDFGKRPPAVGEGGAGSGDQGTCQT
jgi:hypothetical protein